MASDEKSVTQTPIKLLVQGDGPFRTIKHSMVPEPPEGCESQQVFDWAATVSAMRQQHLSLAIQMRVVSVYAERWKISTEEVSHVDDMRSEPG